MEFFIIMILLFTVVVLILAALISNSISKQEKQLARIAHFEKERLKTENYLANLLHAMYKMQVPEFEYRMKLMRRAEAHQCSGVGCSDGSCHSDDSNEPEVDVIDAEDVEVPDGTFGSNDKR